MSLTEILVRGTLTADGTLHLDEKPNLPAGRVQVVLRQETANRPQPQDREIFQLMEEIWAGQKARGHAPRTVEEVEAERQSFRSEVENEIEAAIRLQEECRQKRHQAERETIKP